MTGIVGNRGFGSRWRRAAWSLAALVLVLPLAAMQVTKEVDWSAVDFAFAAAMILGTGIVFEAAVKSSSSGAYRAAFGVALAAVLLLIWMNLAVGIIGSEDHPGNLMYAGVLSIAVVGAAIARFRPGGMARAMIGAAVAQALVGAVAIVAGLGYPASPALELLLLNAFFVALWLVSAWLFRKAARAQT